jgi:hypothetical protein
MALSISAASGMAHLEPSLCAQDELQPTNVCSEGSLECRLMLLACSIYIKWKDLPIVRLRRTQLLEMESTLGLSGK